MTFDDALSRLRAGLDEDEWIARAAIEQYSGDASWSVRDFGFEGIAIGPEGQFDENLRTPVTDHIERQDPKATLDRVEAIRKVIEAEIQNLRDFDGEWGDNCSADDIRAGKCTSSGNLANSVILAALASIYTADETEGTQP